MAETKYPVAIYTKIRIFSFESQFFNIYVIYENKIILFALFDIGCHFCAKPKFSGKLAENESTVKVCKRKLFGYRKL